MTLSSLSDIREENYCYIYKEKTLVLVIFLLKKKAMSSLWLLMTETGQGLFPGLIREKGIAIEEAYPLTWVPGLLSRHNIISIWLLLVLILKFCKLSRNLLSRLRCIKKLTLEKELIIPTSINDDILHLKSCH